MKLPEKIVMLGLAAGFLIMTINHYLLLNSFYAVQASELAGSELFILKGTCSEDYENEYERFLLSVKHEGNVRKVSVSWKSFFKDHSISFSVINSAEC